MSESATALVEELHHEAQISHERRMLVVAGDRSTGYDLVREMLETVRIPVSETTLIGPTDRLACEHLEQAAVDRLLGTTNTAIVYDAHDALVPNTLGVVSGIVDGGGLLFVLTPPLDRWPDRRDAFDERLAVPPYSVADVGNRFKRRTIQTLKEHRGIAILSITDSNEVSIERRGTTDPVQTASDRQPLRPTPPEHHAFPAPAYATCVTADQVGAVAALETLRTPETAVVIEADRGRGKSSAAGIAAACLAATGENVLVTAPDRRNVKSLFDRVTEVFDRLDVPVDRGGPMVYSIPEGGSITFAPAADLDIRKRSPDVLFVDEAAAIPVHTLEGMLGVDRVAFVTTIHGYEGAGRGFSVRFRDHLEASEHAIEEYSMTEPIRYAAGDPIEIWAFRTLLLDARPPHGSVIDRATPESTVIERPSQARMAENETLLRETVGLLVLAHYRTEPNDVARLLDAPNLETVVLTIDGHVVAVALVATEGGLSAIKCRDLHRGGHIAGHMLPDLLISQLRDVSAGRPTGRRIVRIATHERVRGRGLGSHLVSAIVDASREAGTAWVGTGFGATPELISFWVQNGFRSIHLATTRNERSGKHSVIMLRPTNADGGILLDRHSKWFLDRFDGMLADPLSDAEPDIVVAVLESIDGTVRTALTDRQWRMIAAAAYGPGLYDIAPGPFRDLTLQAFVDGTAGAVLDDRQAALLVMKVLQHRSWTAVTAALEYPSIRMCMRNLGRAFQPLVDEYGPPPALEERDRYREGD